MSNRVVLHPDGPLEVRGALRIAGTSDPAHEAEAWLCRCGQSSNKPFCDGTHSKCGFVDPGEVAKTGGDATDDAPLEISAAANGPLLLSGPFEVVGDDGQAHFRGTKAALCRCGQSATKPFCDGRHKAAGFTAE